MQKVCLINVGVNTSHGTLRSPLFSDRKFEFIPIPDGYLKHNEGGLKYCELKAYNGIKITDFINRRYHQACVHYDPEFESYTYGDYPSLFPRVTNLRKLNKDDYIFFFSRLVRWKNSKFTKEAKFYLIGFIQIEKIFSDIYNRPSDTDYESIRNNAHIIRAECNPIFYDGFWIFKGSNRSKRLKHAIPFDREFIEGCALRDANNHKWNWCKFKSDLSVIGSYLRSAKLINEKKQLDLFWKQVKDNGSL